MANNSVSSAVSFADLVTIEELERIIPVYGPELTIVIQSEPGCGKSSILQSLEEKMGTDEWDFIYVDCALKDVGDIAMSIPVHAEKRMEQYISSLFDFTNGKRKMVMLDEFMKSPKLLQVMWTRLMLERCVGDKKLPAGSVVFATSNNQADGVGDTMLAHAGNRVCIVRMKKPDHTAWNIWATKNKISAVIRAWVAMNTRALNSYLELNQKELDENPYIFNPKRPQLSFVSPRSLAKSDVIVRNRPLAGENMTKAALAGTVGKAAAESMAAFMSLEQELISTKAVLKDPDGVPLPTKTAAIVMMLFNAVDEIEVQDELTKFMKFLTRIGSTEMEAIFFTMMVQNKRTVKIAMNNKAISDWARANIELF